MAIQGLRVTVSTTATLLTSTTPSDSVLYNQKGQTVLVQNPSSTVTVYVGGSDVSSSVYGYSLDPLDTFSIDVDGGESLYAAVANNTQQVNVLRKGI